MLGPFWACGARPTTTGLLSAPRCPHCVTSSALRIPLSLTPQARTPRAASSVPGAIYVIPTQQGSGLEVAKRRSTSVQRVDRHCTPKPLPPCTHAAAWPHPVLYLLCSRSVRKWPRGVRCCKCCRFLRAAKIGDRGEYGPYGPRSPDFLVWRGLLHLQQRAPILVSGDYHWCG